VLLLRKLNVKLTRLLLYVVVTVLYSVCVFCIYSYAGKRYHVVPKH